MTSGVDSWPRLASRSAYRASPSRFTLSAVIWGQWAEALLTVGSAVSHPVGGILVGPDKPGGVHISRGFCSSVRFDGARGKTGNKTENESRDGQNYQVLSIGWYFSLVEWPFRRGCSAVVIHLSASTSNESADQRETKPAQIFDRTRIYDRIDARRNLSLGEVHWRHSPRWTAHSLCEVPSTQTQQSARIHGRCRAAKLQAAPAKTLG